MPDANIGGPIVKNKTFFFFGYQRLHEKKVAQVDISHPTAAMKAGRLQFPGRSNAKLSSIPATTRRDANGNWARDPFAGNCIPAEPYRSGREEGACDRSLGLAEPPGTFNSTGPVSNYLADEFAKVFFDDYNLRLDHQFSSDFKIYGSWTENRQNGLQRPIEHQGRHAATFDAVAGTHAPSTAGTSRPAPRGSFSPTVINDTRVGYIAA